MTINYLPILLNFILGGFAVAVTSILGNYMNPLAGAIFWSYPITIIPSLFFMREHGKNDAYLSKFLISTTFGLAILAITTIAISKFINSHSLWVAIAKGTLVYLLAAGLFFTTVKFTGLEHYFM